MPPDWAGRVLRRVRALPAWTWTTAVVLALGVSWLSTVGSGDLATGARHLFYVPIILAAARGGIGWTAVTALVATLLAGPLAGPEPVSDWLARAPFYVGLGVLIASLVEGAEGAARRESELQRKERDLAAERAGFIESVSHQFRTPLTVIRGVAGTLLDRGELTTPEGKRLVGSLARATDRLTDLVTVVLASSSAIGEDLRSRQDTVDILDVARDVCAELGDPDLERVRIMPSTEETQIVTVDLLLRLVLRALIENAMRHSPEGAPIDLTVARDAGDVTIVVRDRGPGLTWDEIHEAFHAFAHSDDPDQHVRGRLGLGLFSARQLARQLGGDLELVPSADEGLRAEVTLPQRREGDPRRAPRRSPMTTDGA